MGVRVKGVHATANAFVYPCSCPVVVERIACPSVHKLSQFGFCVSGMVESIVYATGQGIIVSIFLKHWAKKIRANLSCPQIKLKVGFMILSHYLRIV